MSQNKYVEACASSGTQNEMTDWLSWLKRYLYFMADDENHVQSITHLLLLVSTYRYQSDILPYRHSVERGKYFFFFNAWWSVVDKQNIWTYDYCCYIGLRCHSNRVQDSVHKNRIQFSKNKTPQIIAISRIHLFDLWVFCFQFFLLFKQFITRFDCTYHCFSDWAHAWSLEFCNDSWLE